MAIIVDVKIDERIREVVREQFRGLDLRAGETISLAQQYGVQPRTLEGWIEGRGNPAPKATEGAFLLSGEIPETWGDRIITGLLLAGGFTQVGSRGQIDTYRDDIGVTSLENCLRRAIDYLTRDTGDEWIDAKWRRIEMVSYGGGMYELIVDYARGDSNEEAL